MSFGASRRKSMNYYEMKLNMGSSDPAHKDNSELLGKIVNKLGYAYPLLKL